MAGGREADGERFAAVALLGSDVPHLPTKLPRAEDEEAPPPPPPPEAGGDGGDGGGTAEQALSGGMAAAAAEVAAAAVPSPPSPPPPSLRVYWSCGTLDALHVHQRVHRSARSGLFAAAFGELRADSCNVFGCAFAAVECAGQAEATLRANRLHHGQRGGVLGWTCGNMAATTQDVSAFYHDLLVAKRILSPASLQAMQDFHLLDFGWARGGIYYGGGLMIEQSIYHGTRIPPHFGDWGAYMGHGGDTYGFLSEQGIVGRLDNASF